MATDDDKKDPEEIGQLTSTTGVELLYVALILGSGLIAKWAVFLIIAGMAIGYVSRTAKWAYSKVPKNPFKK